MQELLNSADFWFAICEIVILLVAVFAVKRCMKNIAKRAAQTPAKKENNTKVSSSTKR